MLLMLALLSPWLVLLLLWLPPTRGLGRYGTAWAALPALLLALVTPVDAVSQSFGPLRFSVDELGRSFLLFSSLVWWAVGLFTPAWMAQQREPLRFSAILTLTLAGSIGLILAADLLTFYVCFALASLAAWGLVLAGPRTLATRHAGRTYLLMMVIAELALLTGIAAAAIVDGLAFRSLTPAGNGGLALASLAVGFAIKLGVLGVHFWLPPAHATAPLPASAVLSGVLIKAGLLGWLRVAPQEPDTLQVWSWPLILLGLLASLYAALIGSLQAHPKRVLAYSTVSQVGLIMVALALTLMAEGTLTATTVTFLAGHHALAKAAAFLGLGLLMIAPAPQRLAVLIGLGSICGVLIGLPWTSGAMAKALLTDGLQQQGAEWAIWLLTLSSITTTCLLLRFLLLAWQQPQTERSATGRTMPMLAFAALLTATLFAPCWLASGPISVSLDQIWPAAVGIALAGLCARLGKWPAARGRGGFAHVFSGLLPRPSAFTRFERHLLRWRNMGRLMLLLALALAGLLALDG